MRDNRLKLWVLLAVLGSAGISGCKWDSALYNEFVSDNGIVQCPPRIYYQLDANSDTAHYVCIQYDDGEISVSPCDANGAIIDPDDEPIKVLGCKDGYFTGTGINSDSGARVCNDGAYYDNRFQRLENVENAIKYYNRWKKDADDTQTGPGLASIKWNEKNITLDDLEDVAPGDDTTCPKGDCTSFKQAFQFNLCPSASPVCTVDNMGFHCIAVNNGQCSSNSDCTPEMLPHMKSARCDRGVCVIKSCDSGYILRDEVNQCHEENSSCCGEDCISCEVDQKCEDHVCGALCLTGEHFNSVTKKCEKDSVKACGSESYDCTKAVGWSHGYCQNKTCIADVCDIGYHLFADEGVMKCVADTSDACGENLDVCANGEVCSFGTCTSNCNSNPDINAPHQVACKVSSAYEDYIVCADPMRDSVFCGADESCEHYVSCGMDEICSEGECRKALCISDDDGVEKTLCEIEIVAANGEKTIERECFDLRTDSAHCGSCDLDCAKLARSHEIADACSGGRCTFKCEAGFTNCGDEFEPRCVPDSTFLNDPNNCGGCGLSCGDFSYCKEKKCIIHTCANPAQCLNMAANQCENTPQHCGRECKNCNEIPNVEVTACTESGFCMVSSCKTGYHLNAAKTGCEQNSASACAAVNSSDAKNCRSVIANSNSTECWGGSCRVTQCNTDYHLNADHTACVANSVNACASTNSSTTQSCVTANVADAICTNGVCAVKKCKENFHLSADARSCVANSNKACAQQNVSSATDCSKISYAAETACTSGFCLVLKCHAGFHLNSKKTACEQNSATSCAAVNSSAAQNCGTAIPNSATTKCDSGVCKPVTCAQGYKLSNDGNSCVKA